MNETPICRICKIPLDSENWPSSRKRIQHYICNTCERDRKARWELANKTRLQASRRKWYREHKEAIKAKSAMRRRTNGIPLMSENESCPLFLGVHVAERVLANVFKNVKRMPTSNPGYDFICGKGFKIDVKSSCFRSGKHWVFGIRHNKTADYFLCLAFDNREDLNPLYLWLLPGDYVNSRDSAGISPTTIHKWDDYLLDVDKVVSCCESLKR